MSPEDRATGRMVLAIPLGADNGAGARTVHGYLFQLVLALWAEKECFSGKYPFGGSGWEFDLYTPLIRAGLVSGRFDEYGYVIDIDQATADELVRKAICVLLEPPEPP